MKRFRWPLQRLLDVTVQKELALRAELFALARRMSELHQEIIRRHSLLRELLGRLGKAPLDQRIADQQIFMRTLAVEQRCIGRLESRLGELREQRQAAAEKLAGARRSRKTLERLREEARSRHRREVRKQEQKRLDETASVAFARRDRRPAALGAD